MLDITNYHHVFPQHSVLPSSYPAQRFKSIKQNRSKLSPLFFDRVCDQLNLQSIHEQYPPKDERALQALHQAIADADVGAQQRASLLYYILLDLQGSPGAAGAYGEEPDRFARAIGLGDSQRFAMTGYWEMDRLEFRAALDHLTHPSVHISLSTDVLSTLLTHAAEQQSLPLAYYHAVRPPLPLHSALREQFYTYLTEISPVQTLYASRASPDRSALFELMVRAVLESDADADRAELAVQLVDLPFDAEEERWWEEYLGGGKGAMLPNASDLLAARSVAVGRGGAMPGRVGGEKRLKVDGVDWGVIRDGVVRGLGGRIEVGLG